MSEEQNATSEVVRKGFRYGLAGAAVRKDGNVIGGRFTVNKRENGKVKTVADWQNVEAPYPVNEKAAAEAAADCKTSIYTLDSNGDAHEVKLTGLAAAVTIAIQQRRDEGFRGKVRGGSIKGEDQLRKAILGTYGFQIDRVEAVVSREELAAILADDSVSNEDKMAAMEAVIAAGGATVK